MTQIPQAYSITTTNVQIRHVVEFEPFVGDVIASNVGAAMQGLPPYAELVEVRRKDDGTFVMVFEE